MQERCEETVSIPEAAEGKLSSEVAAMELAENRGIEVKQEKEAEERQSFWKERGHPHHHHPHPHGHGHGHGHHHPLHHLLRGHHHHMEKKWEKLEKKGMKMCGRKIKKGGEGGWNSKFVGKLKHKIEKIDWKIGSLQEKKLFILRKIQEIEEEEERKKNEGVQAPSAPTLLPNDAA